jgi:CO/xanthine dehydrogenase Mo-binding subunit
MPTYVAAELGMQPEDFSMLYQDTDAAPWDMGSCGSQTTFNSGRGLRPRSTCARSARCCCRRAELREAT